MRRAPVRFGEGSEGSPAVSREPRAGIRRVSGALLTTKTSDRQIGGMDIAVLGPVQVNGSARGLSPRDRVVLAALVAEYDIAVSQDTLADALWGDSPPSSATKIVQG